ncbi:hypothetical protein J8I88_14920 [Duffyella gerundensis]|uniref:hypothetical protein n=1 Tax=Duffyella gerundensis TaxID=1619313 RepID=UPI001AE80024|nr:hypothetical protein [Duffyella gerundensis]QTO53804.1 hypothetical protein J8I88_14920 [Duffyella gerundensis]
MYNADRLQLLIRQVTQQRERFIQTGAALHRIFFIDGYILLGRITQDVSQSPEIRDKALEAMHQLALRG